MRLLLKRRYTPRESLGRLFLGQRQLCFIREAPKNCFGSKFSCMEEGIYELEPIHSEASGWQIRVGDKGLILSKAADQLPGTFELCPVSCYRADGTPLFTKLAFQKLLDELGEYWGRGEILQLQIESKAIPYSYQACQIPSYS